MLRLRPEAPETDFKSWLRVGIQADTGEVLRVG